MSLEGEIETEVRWRKLVFDTLAEIKEGEVYRIDLVPDFIKDGYVSREEAILFIEQGLSKFIGEIKAMGIFKRYLIRPSYMNSLNELYKEAKIALNKIEEGEEPIYFRGNTI
ncbi:MAG: hypothetical protein PWR30_273 [Candidatus Woesearchaeota archaeon]|nr:hypothetical protein [Candidatus Woesearchaeota archaeon]